LERQNDGETSTKKLDKQNRRHYQHAKESKFQPIVIEQAVTHKIKVRMDGPPPSPDFRSSSS
jgi:hypothetical protein